MKAGIISLYGNVNYGNKLQNYAVQEVMKKLGYDTEVIYIQSSKSKAKQLMKYLVYQTPLRLIKHTSTKSQLLFKREQAFMKFCKQYITEKRYRSVEQIQDMDVFVVGSDQVWSPRFMNATNQELYFASFAKPEQKLCFSPSFGLNRIPDEWKPIYKQKLNSFPAISVREESGREIVKELTGKEAVVLIDPTMMLGREEWLHFARMPKNIDVDEKFILTYFLGDIPQKAQEDIQNAQRAISGKVYRLMDTTCPELFACDPTEFVYMFSRASLVLTDSFHACVFSFLLGRPFLVYEREGARNDMFTRIETLLTTFDLKRKYVESGLTNEMFEADYVLGYNRLQKERKKVRSFLETSLKQEYTQVEV